MSLYSENPYGSYVNTVVLFEGMGTDNEFHTLRTLGRHRPTRLCQIVHDS